MKLNRSDLTSSPTITYLGIVWDKLLHTRRPVDNYFPLPDMLVFPSSNVPSFILERQSLIHCWQTGMSTIYLFPLLSSSACAYENYGCLHAAESSWLPFLALHPLVVRTPYTLSHSHNTARDRLSEDCACTQQKWRPSTPTPFF